jgi:cysteine desulfuration protein SufE
MSELPIPLQEIVADFQYCEGQEKLEYLLEFAESLPPLPDWLQGNQNKMDQVHECMTPVFVYPEKLNDGLFFHFDIPPESPTVRGYAAILQQGLKGATPAQIQAIPNEFYLQMGLQGVLSGQRLNGIGAILAHMKKLSKAFANDD